MHLIALYFREAFLFRRCLLFGRSIVGFWGELVLLHKSANVLLSLLVQLDQKSLEVLLILLLDGELLLLEQIIQHGKLVFFASALFHRIGV